MNYGYNYLRDYFWSYHKYEYNEPAKAVDWTKIEAYLPDLNDR